MRHAMIMDWHEGIDLHQVGHIQVCEIDHIIVIVFDIDTVRVRFRASRCWSDPLSADPPLLASPL